MIRKYQNWVGTQPHSLTDSVPSRNQFLATTVKTYAKTDIKVFMSGLDLLDFFTFFHIFSPGSTLIKIF